MLTKYRTILVIGANSELINPLIRKAYDAGLELHLTYNNSSSNIDSFRDRRAGEKTIFLYKLDLSNETSVNTFCNSVNAEFDLIIVSAGKNDDGLDATNQTDFTGIKRLLYVNLISVIHIIDSLIEKQRAVTTDILDIICIASISGIRGRKKNMYYSLAKAGLISYASSLRNKWRRTGIRVFTVIPGYVDTQMISKEDPPKWLVVSPTRLCEQIMRGLRRKNYFIYPNFTWHLICICIRIIPERLFNRINM